MIVKKIKFSLTSLNQLNKFISRLGEAKNKFRYFDKRPISIITTHIITIAVFEDNDIIGYGHLDSENDTIWLGIAVLPDFQNRKIGNLIMSELIRFGLSLKLKYIDLTVDKDNASARKLYEKFGFEIITDNGHICRYQLKLDE